MRPVQGSLPVGVGWLPPRVPVRSPRQGWLERAARWAWLARRAPEQQHRLAQGALRQVRYPRPQVLMQ
jgi:hypothetical protein